MSEFSPSQLIGFQPGSVLAGYRLERQVGAGGMAVVFRALDERLGRPVALKILSPSLSAAGSEFRQRFIAESRSAAAVDDPYIIPVYEAGEADGVLFIAMRYVAGGDLRQVIEREGALETDRAAEFVSPVASALDAAHSVGLVHRDVKPGNILVDRRAGRPDHVYLSDFGIVKSAVAGSLTGVGNGYLGTPGYMAPEQIAGRSVDGRADQYSLACVTVQLLTGRVPFERDQVHAVIYAHLSVPPPSLVERRPDLPAAVDQVVAKAMAKVPEKRFESCGDFADALRDALGLASYHRRHITAAPSSPSSPASAPAAPSDPGPGATIDSGADPAPTPAQAAAGVSSPETSQDEIPRTPTAASVELPSRPGATAADRLPPVPVPVPPPGVPAGTVLDPVEAQPGPMRSGTVLDAAAAPAAAPPASAPAVPVPDPAHPETDQVPAGLAHPDPVALAHPETDQVPAGTVTDQPAPPPGVRSGDVPAGTVLDPVPPQTDEVPAGVPAGPVLDPVPAPAESQAADVPPGTVLDASAAPAGPLPVDAPAAPAQEPAPDLPQAAPADAPAERAAEPAAFTAPEQPAAPPPHPPHPPRIRSRAPLR